MTIYVDHPSCVQRSTPPTASFVRVAATSAKAVSPPAVFLLFLLKLLLSLAHLLGAASLDLAIENLVLLKGTILPLTFLTFLL